MDVDNLGCSSDEQARSAGLQEDEFTVDRIHEVDLSANCVEICF